MKERSDIGRMIKEAGILFLITLAAGLILGTVYEQTKEPIRVQKELAVEKACLQVFPEAESFRRLDYMPEEELMEELRLDGVKIGTVYMAEDSGAGGLGYVIQSTSGEGYGGDITIYVGITKEGTINGISILEISETPGLGMRAEEDLAPQFQNKQAGEFSYTKTGSRSESEIDAISGATVTTEAVVHAVNGGLRIWEELTEGGGSYE